MSSGVHTSVFLRIASIARSGVHSMTVNVDRSACAGGELILSRGSWAVMLASRAKRARSTGPLRVLFDNRYPITSLQSPPTCCHVPSTLRQCTCPNSAAAACVLALVAVTIYSCLHVLLCI